MDMAARRQRRLTVADVMTSRVHVANPLAPFELLVRLIEENRVGAIPIVDQQGVPVGVVSESDLLPKEWHAERAARRPKVAKLAINAALRSYAQERLAGVVGAPGGTTVPGPAVSWKGRRHGPRQDRRWAAAWSPQQIARRLRLDFPDGETMRISREANYQALYIQGRGRCAAG